MTIFSQAPPDDILYQLNLQKVKFRLAIKNNEDFESLKTIKQKINELEGKLKNEQLEGSTN